MTNKDKDKDCPECDGLGFASLALDDHGIYKATRPNCNGTGKVEDE